MLTELRIRDFAIIDDLQLSLGAGLSIFTGETGAGKSIIVDALELLLGERADVAVVRAGTDKALIEGDFDIPKDMQAAIGVVLEREALMDDPGHVSLGREIRLEGRNVCRVNGRVVNLGVLKELGELLVDVHGQSEHLSLLRVSQHQGLLDRYAGLDERLTAYRAAYDQWAAVQTELLELQRREQDADRRADLLRFQINEIEAAALQPNEEPALLEERARLANAEKLAALSEQAIAVLEDGSQGDMTAIELLGQAVGAVDALAEVDASLADTRAEAQALLEQVGDLTRRLRLYREMVESNPGRLEEVEERVGLIHDLSRKYGGSPEAVAVHLDKARAELESITHASERLQELEVRRGGLLDVIGRLGTELSDARKTAGDQLGQAIEAELKALSMDGAEFKVALDWRDDPNGALVDGRRVAFGSSGLDQVEFMVAPNPGEGLKPLVKIASGGETSRLMLGLKGVLARADETPSLVFDEIDQGIGGRVGAVVGEKLWELARAHQVMCITHLPQLAAFGDHHFRVEKHVGQGRTTTVVSKLKAASRTLELAQMLGGDTAPNQESARQLLASAEARRQSDRPLVSEK